MSGRKKFGTVSRSEYDDAILRNNVRADNRLTRELKDVERAQKVKFRDISFETKRIRSKIPSGDRNFHKSAECQKYLLQMSRQETMSAQAKTSLLSLDEFAANDEDFGDRVKSASLRDTKSESSLENMKSEKKPRHYPGRKALQCEVNLNEEENCLISDRSLSDRKKVWESLSTPKHQNKTRAVRERLESEFIKSRNLNSSSPVVHMHNMSPAGLRNPLPSINHKNDISSPNFMTKSSSLRSSSNK